MRGLPEEDRLSRRAVLKTLGAGVVTLAAGPVVASCTGTPTPSPSTTTPATPDQAASPGTTGGSTSSQEPTGKVTYGWQTSFVPTWFDPLENPAVTSPYIVQYALHDAIIKPLPGNPHVPSLAESYEVAPDFMSATFKLREGITFHNGDPVTPEDAKFTFENYRGANAQLHARRELVHHNVTASPTAA